MTFSLSCVVMSKKKNTLIFYNSDTVFLETYFQDVPLSDEKATSLAMDTKVTDAIVFPVSDNLVIKTLCVSQEEADVDLYANVINGDSSKRINPHLTQKLNSMFPPTNSPKIVYWDLGEIGTVNEKMMLSAKAVTTKITFQALAISNKEFQKPSIKCRGVLPHVKSHFAYNLIIPVSTLLDDTTFFNQQVTILPHVVLTPRVADEFNPTTYLPLAIHQIIYIDKIIAKKNRHPSHTAKTMALSEDTETAPAYAVLSEQRDDSSSLANVAEETTYTLLNNEAYTLQNTNRYSFLLPYNIFGSLAAPCFVCSWILQPPVLSVESNARSCPNLTLLLKDPFLPKLTGNVSLLQTGPNGNDFRDFPVDNFVKNRVFRQMDLGKDTDIIILLDNVHLMDTGKDRTYTVTLKVSNLNYAPKTLVIFQPAKSIGSKSTMKQERNVPLPLMDLIAQSGGNLVFFCHLKGSEMNKSVIYSYNF